MCPKKLRSLHISTHNAHFISMCNFAFNCTICPSAFLDKLFKNVYCYCCSVACKCHVVYTFPLPVVSSYCIVSYIVVAWVCREVPASKSYSRWSFNYVLFSSFPSSVIFKGDANYLNNSSILVTEKREEKPPTWALSKFLKEISQTKENVGKKCPG